MEIFKKVFPVLAICSTFGFLSTGNIYAQYIDFTLEDNKEEKKVSIIADSEDTNVPAMDINIVYSENVSIEDVELAEGFCSFLFEKYIQTDKNSLQIECFNDIDTDTIMAGTFATFTYTVAEGEDYYFYLDQENIDLGDLTLGQVIDVNKPEEIGIDFSMTDPGAIEAGDVEDSKEIPVEFETIRTFLKDNTLYVLAGVVLLFAAVILIGSLGGKEKKEEKSENEKEAQF